MKYCIAIKMKYGCKNSNNVLEIDQILLQDYGTSTWYKKETLYEYLMRYPHTIKVKDIYGPYVVPAISSYGEKYVKSSPNYSKTDNLLNLPRI